MTPERWRQIEELFARADQLPETELEGFLATSCAGDPSLRAELVELLGFRGADGSLHRIVGAAAAVDDDHAALQLPDRLVDRFQIRGRLGAGGMGVVFEAYDEQRGELVALKALPHNDAHRIGALKQEFRVLANVSHPRLVRLHELFTDGDHWFFTMEKIDGSSYLEHVRPHGVVDERALRIVLRDLVDGVHAIHRAGRLHRDLKPSNVRIADGRAVILDFGLARALHDEGVEIAGTPDYMAPEAFAGRASREGDWYALGVMLGEALTGVRPRSARDVHDGGAADLVALARGLLAADPAARPAALAAAGLAEEAGETASTDVFIGRARELAALRSALGEVQTAQRPVLVRVEGASGIGKSTLVAHYLDSLDGAVVLRGRCYERENVPFKALDAIVDALAHHLEDHLAPPIDHVGDLCRIFPPLGRVFAAGPTTSDPRVARQRATTALAALFASVAATQPLVIAIDDLQWGDTDSGHLIGALLSAGIPALWIVSYRSNEPCVLADALVAHVGPHLVIEAMTPAEAAELVGALTHGADWSRVDAIVGESGGNPFFIGELARSAPRLAGTRLDLANLLRDRIGRLDGSPRRLLEVVALAGAPISIAAAARAAGLAGDAAIPELRAGSWVRTNHDRGIVEPYHDRIRNAVVDGLAQADRVALHGALARALELDRAAPEILALHFRESGDRERAGRHTIAAAEAATRMLAFERAAALYRDAIELGGDPIALERAMGDALANAGRGPEAAEAYLRGAKVADATEALDLERRAAHQYFSTGHIAEGQRVGHDVMSRLGLWIPKSPRAAQLVGLARFAGLLVRGHKAPRHTTDTPLALHRYDVTNELFQSLASFEPMHGLYFAASAASRGVRLADPLRRADAVGNIAAIMSLVRGRTGGAAAGWLRAQREIADSIGTTAALGIAATYDGVCATYVGQWSLASQHLGEAERLLASVEGVTYRYQLATVQAIDSWVLFYRGRFAELVRRTARRLEEALAKGNLMSANAQTTHNAIGAPLVADDVATAARMLDAAVGRLPDTVYSQQHTWLLLAWCLHALYTGDALGGHARLHSEIPQFERSRLLDVQIARMQFLWLRASLAAAAARVSSGKAVGKLERECRDSAALLRKVKVGGAEPWADLVEAAVVPQARSRALLERARGGFVEHDMLGFAAAARWQLGGDERAAADAYFRGEGIVRPERFVRMLAGGFPD